jgi:hypothetical protein
MKALTDARALQRLESAQCGVFSKGDIQTVLAEPHPAAFGRRVRALIDNGVLQRFCRGWYVTESFDLATLSQRLAPESYISFGTVLAQGLLIGANPAHKIVAAKLGRPRKYEHGDFVIEHVGVTRELLFGFSAVQGIRYADVEKAALDTLYFHLRGRRFPFDIYSDVAIHKLDPVRLKDYLRRYRNPRFIVFAKNLLEIG